MGEEREPTRLPLCLLCGKDSPPPDSRELWAKVTRFDGIGVGVLCPDCMRDVMKVGRT